MKNGNCDSEGVGPSTDPTEEFTDFRDGMEMESREWNCSTLALATRFSNPADATVVELDFRVSAVFSTTFYNTTCVTSVARVVNIAVLQLLQLPKVLQYCS